MTSIREMRDYAHSLQNKEFTHSRKDGKVMLLAKWVIELTTPGLDEATKLNKQIEDLKVQLRKAHDRERSAYRRKMKGN